MGKIVKNVICELTKDEIESSTPIEIHLSVFEKNKREESINYTIEFPKGE